MKKILVTGGCGYIGSHTIVDLIENNYEIISIDNFSNSFPDVIENIFKITGVKITNYNIDLCDLEALKTSMENGIIAGAAIDVFPIEPKTSGDKFVSPLQNISNVILTPHIGGSTEEAQWNIGIDVASKTIKYIENGSTIGSYSLPELSLPIVENTQRILHIHHNVPGVLGEINKRISNLEVNILGQFLSTNAKVGYVVLDVSKKAGDYTLEELKQVPNTIKARILY